MTTLKKNILANLFGQGMLIVLGFVSVKYIFSNLGQDALGIIYFAMALNAMLCALLGLGVNTTTVREIAAHHEGRPGYVRELVRTGSTIYWGLYALLSVLIFLAAPLVVTRWLNFESMDGATAVAVFRIMGISSLAALPKSYYVALLRGLQRMEITNTVDVATSALQQVGTILILWSGAGIFPVVSWLAFCYGLRLATYLALTARFFSLSSLTPGISLDVLRENARFASRMIFITVTGAVQQQMDRLIISALMPIGMVGYYGVARSTVAKGSLLTGAVSQAAYPSFSELYRAGEKGRLDEQYRNLQNLVCYGIAPFFALLPFVALPLFTYVFDEAIARLLLPPVALLSLGAFMNGTLSVPYVYSLATGRPGITARQHIVDLAVGVPAAALLVWRFELVGAGLSLVLLSLLKYAYGLPRICAECLMIPALGWYAQIIKVAALTGVTYGSAWVILNAAGPLSPAGLAAAYGVATLAFLAGALATAGQELRSSLWHIIRGT